MNSTVLRALGFTVLLGVVLGVSACGTTGHLIAAGGGHSCRLVTGGGVECWGDNNAGQIGLGGTYPVTTVASLIPGLSSVSSIVAGTRSHNCALLTTGRVLCWGDNSTGELGNGTTTTSATPVDTGISNAIDVAAGEDHSCAVISGGAVLCWGANAAGQLGIGTTTASTSPVSTLITRGAKFVAAGLGSTCAVMVDGSAQCWGDSPGNGSSSSLSPVPVSGLSSVAEISSRVGTTCALLTNGTIWCWGSDSSGELGNGTWNQSLVPVLVSGISTATAVAVGGAHVCAVLKDTTVRCWGDNSNFQLGLSSQVGVAPGCAGSPLPSCSLVPVAVPTVTNAVDIAAGDSHSCALLADGRARCWGWNGLGALGNGRTGNDADYPNEVVPQWVTRAFMAAGGSIYDESCALKSGGKIECWGANESGQLGNGSSVLMSSIPGVVSNITSGIFVSVGSNHACAINASTVASCWGDNGFSSISPSAGFTVNMPTAIPIPAGVTAISGGKFYTCAISANPAFVPSVSSCWGNDFYGQLGAPVPTTICSPPGEFAQPCIASPVTDNAVSNEPVWVSAGVGTTCAVFSDLTVWCWGQNYYGALGNGSNTDSFNPVRVSNIANVAAVAVGGYHACALLIDTTVQCWGRNYQGELGNGTTTDSNVPVAVRGLTGATGIAAGADFSCALMSDGTVQCWGDNGLGALGNSAAGTMSTTPVVVTGISTATSLGTGNSAGHVCATLADGSAACWGSNMSGELGRGSTSLSQSTPAPVVSF
jgi:alpha-tubulin suppressor-like RCC1 family protein